MKQRQTYLLGIYWILSFGLLPLSNGFTQQYDWAKDLEHIELNQAGIAPTWALWERKLLEDLYPAALEFVAKYTLPDGTIRWRDEWPGMDGSDDGYESFYNFSLYSALGGPMQLDSLARFLWEGVTRQFTNYGQIHNEFDAGYDWMHHGESYTYFYFFGLTNPLDPVMRERAIRFAKLYMDPAFGNYDPKHKLIRSPLNGSKGPRMVNTAEDWVTHRPILAHYLLPYEDIPGVDSSDVWNDDSRFPILLEAMNERMMKGDVPLNLAATSLMANAYMYTGDTLYSNWVTDYVSVWMQRVRDHQGFLPDNVGLDGKVGSHTGGRKWGGYYGWRWPHGLMNQMEATTIGGSNAYLLTGDSKYLDLPKSVIRLVENESREQDGIQLVPHRFDDRGWWDFRPMQPKYPSHLWYMSRDPEDWHRARRLADPAQWQYSSYSHNSKMVRGIKYTNQSFPYSKGKGDSQNTIAWMGWMDGKNPDYPSDILRATYREMQRRLERVREDDTEPDEQDVHHWLERNPVVLEGLVQCMLGAPNHIYHGGLLQTSVRYFDPVSQRPGVPQDVAALVSRISTESITLELVNLHPTEDRKVLVQGGMFGEHQIKRIRQVIDYPYQFYTVGGPCFIVTLGPGATGQLELDMERFAYRPTYQFPWQRE